ncbi:MULTISPECIES: LapA family protein [Thioalkalivibrio]|uniref:Lipopolysaccharide assembly protein A domain-containing protein n=1 Tax=Thioalkalivibrio halophilus TaxID=252474 RepID=A0A1V3A224_9GAMM|nr:MULTISPECIES: LapA family protein [Thioalkalivibrio]OOC11395.1 hypothetical protein B1A74_01080 [Thioalkalivibrio halophilus]
MAEHGKSRLRHWVAFVALILISSGIGILVVFNEGAATLHLPGLTLEAPLIVLLGLSALAGVLIASLIFWLRLRRLQRKIDRLRDENRALRVEVEQLRTAPMRDFY